MNEILRNIIMGIIVLLLLLVTMAIVMGFYNQEQTQIQPELQQQFQQSPQSLQFPQQLQQLSQSPQSPDPILYPNVLQSPPIIPPIIPSISNDIMTEFDIRSAYDPLVEATKRPPRYITLPMINNPHFNYPTRGFTDSFSLVGYLVEKDGNHIKQEKQEKHEKHEKDTENRIVKLFGRQKYPNSSEYEYYVIINTGYNDNIKYSLENQRKELFDGDRVFIDILHKNYRVKLLKNRIFEYNPYVV